MKIEHALIAVDRDFRIIHLMGFPDVPVYADYFQMVDELKNDPQFGLTDLEAGRDYVVCHADEQTIQMIMDTVNERPEDFDIVEHGLKETE